MQALVRLVQVDVIIEVDFGDIPHPSRPLQASIRVKLAAFGRLVEVEDYTGGEDGVDDAVEHG